MAVHQYRAFGVSGVPASGFLNVYLTTLSLA
jgi:hypothetical protein